ncbi:MAG: glucoamylase family protein [Steroidobacteraceae bacterium]
MANTRISAGRVRPLLWGAAVCLALLGGAEAAAATVPASQVRADDPLLDDLEARTFRFFWETADPHTGLIPDRYPGPSFASIAAVGFALTAYPIGVERGYISRAAARTRVLTTLRFFARAHNEHGFFYHFLDMRSGKRAGNSEISTVDTALLLAGMIFCETYFDSSDPRDAEIRRLAEEIYERADWTWAQPRAPAVALAWTPEAGFSTRDWTGYNEAMVVYLLALGSPTHPIGVQAWTQWTSTYDRYWGTLYDQTFLGFAPLFGHQYTHVWVDFRGIRDQFMRDHGLDYFENSRRATYTQRRYAIANPKHWEAYGRNVWGISASDGPGPASENCLGQQCSFLTYAARGVGLKRIVDDGTIAPTAALSSLPFAPEIVLPAAHEMYRRYGSEIYSTYGFVDAFNASFPSAPSQQAPRRSMGWVDPDYVGIDEGPILAMIENYRSDFVWRFMRGSPYLREGLKRAGFSGGWLAQAP